MNDLSSKGRQRVGRRSTEASVASRSGAPANALGVGLPPAAAAPQDQTDRGVLLLPCIRRRTHSSRVRLPQLADQQSREVDLALSSALGFQPYRIPDERFPHKALPPLPFDLSVAAHSTHSPVRAIAQSCAPRVTWSGTIDLRRRSVLQSFVRTNPVVDVHPTVGAPLLRSPMARGWACRFGLEHPMHLLVGSILFRMPRRNEFDPNPQRRPPGAQARQPRWPCGSEGTAIVRANHRGIAVLPEQVQESPTRWPPTLILEQAGHQYITTERIAHRQRFHPPAIRRSKPTFEVHRPHLVAALSNGQPSPPHLRPSGRAAALTAAQLHSPQPLAHGPGTGNRLTGMFFAHSRCQFPASPASISPPQTPNPDQPLRGNLPRRAMRPTSPTSQTARPFPLESRHPLVAALAAHSKTPTQLRHALLGLQGQLHEPQPSHHRRKFFP